MSVQTRQFNQTASAVVIVVAAVLFAAGAAQAAATDRFQKVADSLVRAINAGDHPGVQRDFSQVMLDAFGLDKSKPFFERMTAQHGKITRLDPPRFMPPDQAVFVVRLQRGVLDLKIVLDEADKIIGMWFLPHVPPLPVPERNQTKLSLPFKGAWRVMWGGDTKQVNRHHEVTNQRFAFDFLGVDERGRTHWDRGRKNEDYYAFGREILAPADGVVTDVIRGVRDCTPGTMNPYVALGNAVFIEHRPHEVSVLAHFKQGSVRVKVGDRVKRGQVIGLCGNSGNSSEPHLHYHLQNTPIIQDGTGVKCFFDTLILRNGDPSKSVTDYSPVKGDVVVAKGDDQG